MMIQIKTRYVILAVFIALTATFVLGRYLGRQKANRASTELISTLNGKLTHYQYKLDSITKYASEQKQLVVEQKVALESGLIEKAELKKLHLRAVSEVTRLKAQVEILIDSISHDGDVVVINPFPLDPDEEQPVLYLPFQFRRKDKFVDLKGGFNEKGEMSLDLKVPVKIDLWTGYNKKLGGYTATITSDNPHFIVSDINSIKVQPKNKKFGAGLQVGFGVSIQKNPMMFPYIGFGISRNIISF